MRVTFFITAATLLGVTSTRAQPGPLPDSIRRLTPAAFADLPNAVRHDLESRECSVPQPWDGRAPHNVIRGAFTNAGVVGWAVLCSVRDTSQILIYRASSGNVAQVVDSLLRDADRAWMQGIGGNRWGYSRLLQTMPLRKIRAWRNFDGHAVPQPIDHDAIQQVFLDKAAEAFYFAAGRWYRHTTAD